MSTTEHPMPDFVDALERHLRQAATEHAATSLAARFPLPEALPGGRRPGSRPAAAPDTGGLRRLPRTAADDHQPSGRATERAKTARRLRLRLPVAAGSLAIVAALVVLVLVLSGSGPATPRALGEPLVLRTPLVALPKAALPGSVAQGVLGPSSARITRGNAFRVEGGTAYLYRNAAGVCLSIPDPASSDPDLERGVTCVATADFRRFGIYGALTGATEAHYVAAIPDGAKPPTVSVRGGAARTLTPSDIGIVTYTATAPTVITRFGPGDATERDEFLQPLPPAIRVPSTTIQSPRVPGVDDGRPDTTAP